MKEKVVFEYYDKDEFRVFWRKLPHKEAVKLLVTIEKISKFGLLIAQEQQWIKKLESNLFEIRSHYGNHYIITHGFKKKSNKTPMREIAHAKAIRTKFLKDDSNEK